MKYTMICDKAALIEKTNESFLLSDSASTLDIISTAWENEACTTIILMLNDIDEKFFDLKTKIAGEAIQKFTNYGFKLIIVGNYSIYTSSLLKDFIYESNKDNSLKFVNSIQDAIESL